MIKDFPFDYENIDIFFKNILTERKERGMNYYKEGNKLYPRRCMDYC